ncbi:MAG: flippase [Nanoarchaeota archaeon]
MKSKEKETKLSNSLKLIAASSLIVLFGTLFSKILTYVYRIIIARSYGPESYGLFSLALVIVSMFATISSLGLSEGISRFIPLFRGRNEKSKIQFAFRFLLYSLLALGLIFGTILFISSNFIALNLFKNASLTFYIQIFSILILFTLLSNIFLGFLRAYEKVVWSSFIFNIIQNVVKLILIILFILIGLRTEGIALSYLGGVLIMAIFAYIVCKIIIPEMFLKSKINKEGKKLIIKEILAYSLPMMFFGISYVSFYWIDSVLLGYLKNAESLGFYSAVMPIALLLTVTSDIFMQLFFPLINKEYSKKNFKLIKELSKQVAKWILIINLPVFIIFILFPGAVINILFGETYLVAENALRILSFGGLVSSILIISNSILSMAGKSKTLLADMLVATVLNIILNYILIPLPKIWSLDNSLGINGAALATTVSILFYNLLLLIHAKKYTSIVPIRRKMLSILLSALIPTVVLLYLRSIIPISTMTLIIISLLFISFYIVMIFLTKGLDRNDIKILSLIKNKIKLSKTTH